MPHARDGGSQGHGHGRSDRGVLSKDQRRRGRDKSRSRSDRRNKWTRQAAQEGRHNRQDKRHVQNKDDSGVWAHVKRHSGKYLAAAATGALLTGAYVYDPDTFKPITTYVQNIYDKWSSGAGATPVTPLPPSPTSGTAAGAAAVPVARVMVQPGATENEEEEDVVGKEAAESNGAGEEGAGEEGAGEEGAGEEGAGEEGAGEEGAGEEGAGEEGTGEEGAGEEGAGEEGAGEEGTGEESAGTEEGAGTEEATADDTEGDAEGNAEGDATDDTEGDAEGNSTDTSRAADAAVEQDETQLNQAGTGMDGVVGTAAGGSSSSGGAQETKSSSGNGGGDAGVASIGSKATITPGAIAQAATTQAATTQAATAATPGATGGVIAASSSGGGAENKNDAAQLRNDRIAKAAQQLGIWEPVCRIFKDLSERLAEHNKNWLLMFRTKTHEDGTKVIIGSRTSTLLYPFGVTVYFYTVTPKGSGELGTFKMSDLFGNSALLAALSDTQFFPPGGWLTEFANLEQSLPDQNDLSSLASANNSIDKLLQNGARHQPCEVAESLRRVLNE